MVDILACRDGQFTNVTLNNDTLRSEETIRSYTAVNGTDIDRDGVMEIPYPVQVPGPWGRRTLLADGLAAV